MSSRRVLNQPSFPDLVPDYQESHDEVLKSFLDIRRNTLRDLYGSDGSDKSPKGSVDAAIRPLVDLLNSHPSFSTLSSCSGRIALFDPQLSNLHGESEMECDAHDEKASDGTPHAIHTRTMRNGERPRTTTSSSGKGRGTWLLASHVKVEPSLLPTLLDQSGSESTNRSNPMILKHEPLLLHIAASCLKRGQQLLTIALRLGFRESGLVVSSQRVTVAIRGHGLALAIPIARAGPLRPPTTYLESLIADCNQRMETNLQKLNRLQVELRDTLFRKQHMFTAPNVLEEDYLELPPLNLWRHAAVTVPLDANRGDFDCIVFGGYGIGPEGCSSLRATPGRRSCQRSGEVYSLSRRRGTFDLYWSKVAQSTLPSEGPRQGWTTWYGLEVSQVQFTKCEGISACRLPLSDSCGSGPVVVALFGGRKGPENPCGDLLLYEPNTRPDRFGGPTAIQGELPYPRWGHSFVSLSGRGGLLAVLVGGRDASTCFGMVHVLSITKRAEGASSFRWDLVDVSMPTRFDHSTVTIDNTVIIFGGLSETESLLESFAPSEKPIETCAFDIDSIVNVRERHIGTNGPGLSELDSWASASACAMNMPGVSTGGTPRMMVISGGVPTSASVMIDMEPIRWLPVVLSDETIDVSQADEVKNRKRADFCSLLNHCILPVPSSAPNCSEMIVVGGGASSFAFGPMFARSYHVRLHQVSNDAPDFAIDSLPMARSMSPVPPENRQASKETTDVIYVKNCNAKSLKTALEAESLLDTRYRMTKADAAESGLVAVPITKACVAMVSDHDKVGEGTDRYTSKWLPLVEGSGVQQVPFSSAVLGRRKK